MYSPCCKMSRVTRWAELSTIDGALNVIRQGWPVMVNVASLVSTSMMSRSLPLSSTVAMKDAVLNSLLAILRRRSAGGPVMGFAFRGWGLD